MLRPTAPHTRFTRNVVVITILLLLAAGAFTAGLLLPVQAAPSVQEQEATPTLGGTMNSGMMASGMSMAQMGAMMYQMMAHMHGMMGTMPMSGTMPMEGMIPMCAMMHMDGSMPMTGTMPMMGMMPMTDTTHMWNSMPMSGTMPMMGMTAMTDTMHMAYAGMMMQMMGIMQMHMGCMQMMMGAMMSGQLMDTGMMNGDMMDEGTSTLNATPETTLAAPAVTATVEATATAGVSTNVEGSEPEAEENDSGHPAPALAATPQRATAGAVTVEAVPLASEALLDIAFAITLETHSMELDFDLAELATLTIGEANFPATSWTPNAPSGHHVTGTLHFTIDHPVHAELAQVDEVTLELRDIDGQQVTLRFAVSKPQG